MTINNINVICDNSHVNEMKGNLNGIKNVNVKNNIISDIKNESNNEKANDKKDFNFKSSENTLNNNKQIKAKTIKTNKKLHKKDSNIKAIFDREENKADKTSVKPLIKKEPNKVLNVISALSSDKNNDKNLQGKQQLLNSLRNLQYNFDTLMEIGVRGTKALKNK